jgi:hypothetical protein
VVHLLLKLWVVLPLPLDLLLPAVSLSNNKEPLSFNIKDTYHLELHTQCHNNITKHHQSTKLQLLLLLQLLLQPDPQLSKSHPISELSLFSWLSLYSYSSLLSLLVFSANNSENNNNMLQ